MSAVLSQNNKIIYPHLNHLLKSYYYTTGYSVYSYDNNGKRINAMIKKELLPMDNFINYIAINSILTKINNENICKDYDTLLIEIYNKLYTIVVPIYSNKHLLSFLFIEPFFISNISIYEKEDIFNNIKLSINTAINYKNFKHLVTIHHNKLNYLGQLFFHLLSNCLYIGEQHLCPKQDVNNKMWKNVLTPESLSYTNSLINLPIIEKISEYLYIKDIQNAINVYKTIQTFVSLPCVNQCPIILIKYSIISMITLLYNNLSKHFVELDYILYQTANECILNLKLYNEYGNIIKYGEVVIKKFYEAIKKQDLTNVSPNIFKALVYINRNYTKNIKLHDIANNIPMNKTYLSTQFKKEIGVSLNQYINNYRIKRSINMIKNNKYSLTDIALMVGFESANYFSSIFKKNTGMTPRQYAKQYINTH